MEKSYDWLVLDAKRDPSFKEKILATIDSGNIAEITYNNIYRLNFHPQTRIVTVRPYSETSPFHYKIMPKCFRYEAVVEFLNGNWSALNNENVFDFADERYNCVAPLSA